MSFIVLQKRFDTLDSFTPWESIGFVESEPQAMRLMRSSSFRRGDLFTYVSLEHASAIDEHMQRLAVAKSTTAISWAPSSRLAEVQDTTWLYAYENMKTDRLFALLPADDDQGIALRVLYLCLWKELEEKALDDVDSVKGMKALEGYLFGTVSSGSLAKVIRPLEDKINLRYPLHDLYLILVYIGAPIFGDGHLHSYIESALGVFCHRSFGGDSDVVADRFREIVPLSTLLLALIERKPLAITRDL